MSRTQDLPGTRGCSTTKPHYYHNNWHTTLTFNNCYYRYKKYIQEDSLQNYNDNLDNVPSDLSVRKTRGRGFSISRYIGFDKPEVNHRIDRIVVDVIQPCGNDDYPSLNSDELCECY